MAKECVSLIFVSSVHNKPHMIITTFQYSSNVTCASAKTSLTACSKLKSMFTKEQNLLALISPPNFPLASQFPSLPFPNRMCGPHLSSDSRHSIRRIQSPRAVPFSLALNGAGNENIAGRFPRGGGCHSSGSGGRQSGWSVAVVPRWCGLQ